MFVHCSFASMSDKGYTLNLNQSHNWPLTTDENKRTSQSSFILFFNHCHVCSLASMEDDTEKFHFITEPMLWGRKKESKLAVLWIWTPFLLSSDLWGRQVDSTDRFHFEPAFILSKRRVDWLYFALKPLFGFPLASEDSLKTLQTRFTMRT